MPNGWQFDKDFKYNWVVDLLLRPFQRCWYYGFPLDFHYTLISVRDIFFVDIIPMRGLFRRASSLCALGQHSSWSLWNERCLFRAVAHGASFRSGKPASNESLQRELEDDLRARLVDQLLKRHEDTNDLLACGNIFPYGEYFYFNFEPRPLYFLLFVCAHMIALKATLWSSSPLSASSLSQNVAWRRASFEWSYYAYLWF